ncbi:MAG: DUF438 domain-containing protein [Candidatus Hodarchaeota archaeon]
MLIDMNDELESKAKRKETLKSIITDLHAGEGPEHFKAVKERFENLVRYVDPGEIPEIENELIAEGLPEHEVKRLCDVHVALFKEAMEAQEVTPIVDAPPGHPAHTFMGENHSVAHVVSALKEVLNGLSKNPSNSELLMKWKEYHSQLLELDKHYLRKENLLFPFLEARGITGPPSVMWGLHDEIRAGLKQVEKSFDPASIPTIVLPLLETITGLIWKEENILFPMCMDTLSEENWGSIAEQSDEIGYCLFKPTSYWAPIIEKEIAQPVPAEDKLGGRIQLPSGSLSLKELEYLFNHLPVDLTFVDADDTVAYFSEGQRIFLRPRAAIGRKVQFCHPPDSVHVVNQILAEFKEGTRDLAEFWINFQGRMIHIRYFAVRGENKTYLGTLEVSQDITQIQKIEGEKRLLDPLD